MNIDSSILYALINEIKEDLPARIQKIYQNNNALYIYFRSCNHQNKVLVIDIGLSPVVYSTTENQNKKRAEKPASFCMILRKYAEGGTIENINQFLFERMAALSIRKRNEIGDNITSELKIELMGKHSNIILCTENGIIIDSIKHIHPDMNKFRIVLPGAEYKLPPHSARKNPLEMSIDDWKEIIKDFTDQSENIYQYLNRKVMGININFDYLLNLLDNFPKNGFGTDVFHLFYDFFQSISKNDFFYAVYHHNNKDFPYLFQLKDQTPQLTNTRINDLFADYFIAKEKKHACQEQKRNLLICIDKNVKNLQKKLNECKKNIEEKDDYESYREIAEILLANMHMLHENTESIAAENFYNNNEIITIKLEPGLTPSQNVQRFYKKYNKSKNTIINSQKLLERYKLELQYLENIAYSIETAGESEDLQPIEAELIKGKYIEQKLQKNKTHAHIIEFTLYRCNETLIYAGKNNQQNDYLTLKKADGEDWWFHVKDFPGSHIIVKNKDTELSEDLLVAAAQIAAVNSKAKNSSNVYVDYTKCKNVKKPKGFPLGLVIYDNYRTVCINPDHELVNSMHSN